MADASSKDQIAAPGEAELAGVIGANLRRLRTQHNLTLEALARLSSVSKSMLGEIELGHTTPNITLLYRVANALGVPVPEFLQKWSAPEIQIFRGEGVNQEAGFSSRLLGPVDGRNRVKFHQIRLASACEEVAGPYPQGTLVNLVVGEGLLEVAIGAEFHQLGAGDAAYFPATLSHVYRNPGDVPAVVYLVTIYPVSLNLG